MQVDIGFGDLLPSGAETIEVPTLLAELPAPSVRAYPRDQVVAEKFEAMVKLGRRNSRMKDFHDVWALAGEFVFNGATLQSAVAHCFTQRRTLWSSDLPAALTTAFYEDDEELRARWARYLSGSHIIQSEPPSFAEVGARVMVFLVPIRDAIISDKTLDERWSPAGPWTSTTEERLR